MRNFPSKFKWLQMCAWLGATATHLDRKAWAFQVWPFQRLPPFSVLEKHLGGKRGYAATRQAACPPAAVDLQQELGGRWEA